MDIHKELELQDCPYCGGSGILEEEQGWCFYNIIIRKNEMSLRVSIAVFRFNPNEN